MRQIAIFSMIVLGTIPAIGDEKTLPGFPDPLEPCTCQEWASKNSTAAIVSYDNTGEDDNPLKGFCDYDMLFLQSKFCIRPVRSRCMPETKVLDKKLLAYTYVSNAPQCSDDAFKPFLNPYLDLNTMEFGPFRPGETIRHAINHWFTNNDKARRVDGVAFLSIVHDETWGYLLQGVVPDDAKGDYQGTAVVTNPKGAASVDFKIIIGK